MTQTLPVPTAPAAIRIYVPHVAQTIGYRDSREGIKIRYYLMQSVDQHRAEFGETPEHARSFAQDISCLECGRAACEPLECIDCGVRACACVITEDEHNGENFCTGCARTCMGCRICD